MSDLEALRQMADQDAELPPAEQRRVTVWRILRAAYLRLLAAAVGKVPERLTPGEEITALAPWDNALAHDFRVLCAVLEEARVAGVTDAHDAYHRLEAGVDHETLDLAIEVVAEQAREDERERLLEDA